MQSREISNTFYTIRFFALVSIVLAHSTFYQIPNEFVVKILHAYGRCGVVVFFIASGYYFNPRRYSNIFKMLKDKTSIIIPWILWGIVSYCLRFVREPFYVKPFEIITYILGWGTYFWFLTIWIILLCIFQIIPNNKYLLLGFIAINIFSVFLTSNNIGLFKALQVGSKNTIYLDTYLNIFNWVGFFSGGILLKQLEFFEKFGGSFYGRNKWIVLLLIPILFAMIIIEKEPSYWTYYSIFIEISLFIILLVFSMNIMNIKVLKEIGSISFPIYLLHMQIQGFIFNKILPTSIIMGCLRPIITVLSIYYMLHLGLFISKKINLEKGYRVLFGLKD